MPRLAYMPDPPERGDPRNRSDIPNRIMDGEYDDDYDSSLMTEEDWANLTPIDLNSLTSDDR
jgi:hypothetical protein